MEEQLLRMSVSDGLTGTPNRRAFDQALRGEWRRSSRAREPLSLIMVDIDRFKQFNDRFGHLIGDQALIAVARALTAALGREGDLVARYGGEEFAVVLPGTDLAGAAAIGQQLVEAIRGVSLRQAPDWSLSVSVGTATWHPDEELIKSPVLLGRADEALYEAKNSGRDRAVAYEDSLSARGVLQAAIAAGLADGEFGLHYQPIVDLATGEVVALEALMRWDRPGHGLVAPASFIPAAEASTLICDLGRWALLEAAIQLQPGNAPDWTPTADSVSRSTSPPGTQRSLRSSTTFKPRSTRPESPPTSSRSNSPRPRSGLLGRPPARQAAQSRRQRRHRRLRHRIHLDLRARPPARRHPQDRPNVHRRTGPPPQRLITLMIEAAHSFDLRVVAEGIEDQETLQAMADLDCDTAQGYHIARPMPPEQATEWLMQRRDVGQPHL